MCCYSTNIYYFKQDCNNLKSSTKGLNDDAYKKIKSKNVTRIVDKLYREDIIKDNRNRNISL